MFTTSCFFIHVFQLAGFELATSGQMILRWQSQDRRIGNVHQLKHPTFSQGTHRGRCSHVKKWMKIDYGWSSCFYRRWREMWPGAKPEHAEVNRVRADPESLTPFCGTLVEGHDLAVLLLLVWKDFSEGSEPALGVRGHAPNLQWDERLC